MKDDKRLDYEKYYGDGEEAVGCAAIAIAVAVAVAGTVALLMALVGG